MTVIDKELTALYEVETKAHHFGNLIKALAPDPQEWQGDPTQEPIDAGEGAAFSNNPPRCACGHPIRYQYQITRPRDGKIDFLGSTCIYQLSELNPELATNLQKAVEKHEEKLKELKKLSKEAQQDKEIAELSAKYLEIYEHKEAVHIENRKSGRRSNWDMYHALCQGGLHKYPPEYTRKCDYIRWYKKQIAKAESISEESGSW